MSDVTTIVTPAEAKSGWVLHCATLCEWQVQVETDKKSGEPIFETKQRKDRLILQLANDIADLKEPFLLYSNSRNLSDLKIEYCESLGNFGSGWGLL